MIEKYGEEEGRKRYEEWIKNSTVTLEKMIEKYGEEEGKKRWKQFCERNRYTNTLEYYIETYGEEEEGRKRYNKWVKRLKKYSKESIEFFQPIYEFLINNGFTDNDIYWKEKEQCIYDKKNKRVNFYDFTISKLKLIIEYHGSTWHYNPDYNYKEDFKSPFENLTLEELKERDEYKRNLAIENGFDIIEVFDTDNKEEKQNEIIEFIRT
jgi:ribonuclease BN (tRNA processing enzyme)